MDSWWSFRGGICPSVYLLRTSCFKIAKPRISSVSAVLCWSSYCNSSSPAVLVKAGKQPPVTMPGAAQTEQTEALATRAFSRNKYLQASGPGCSGGGAEVRISLQVSLPPAAPAPQAGAAGSGFARSVHCAYTACHLQAVRVSSVLGSRPGRHSRAAVSSAGLLRASRSACRPHRASAALRALKGKCCGCVDVTSRLRRALPTLVTALQP